MTSAIISAPLSKAAIDSIQNIHVMEDHDYAYDVWRSAGVRGRTLVHFDGHLDFFWLPERPAGDLLNASSSEELDRMLAEAGSWDIGSQPPRASVNIGNFINPAIREGIVTLFYWVIPDPFWSTPSQRALVQSSLVELIRSHAKDASPLRIMEDGIRLNLLGCPLIVCPLSALPQFPEPVLLDIDVDYLVSQKCDYRPPYFERTPTRPWMWPSTFMKSLALAEIPTDLITIAYSVNGGYTPMEYKYFGDVLAKAFVSPEQTLSDAPEPQTTGDLYRQALSFMNAGNPSAAKNSWERLILQDPSYRSVFAFPGYREEIAERWMDALKIYDQIILFDPEWHAPHLGRGRALIKLNRWNEAELSLKTARALAVGQTNAVYWLGRCAWRKKEWDAARDFWQSAVQEAPNDHQSLFCLTRWAVLRRHYSEALNYGRQCIAAGWDVADIHRWMAGSAWKMGKPQVAREEWRLWFTHVMRLWRETLLVLWRKIPYAQNRRPHHEHASLSAPSVF